ncbi:hypothetical protein RRG08_047512 [Elysia crispata]|uniref:Alpha-2-macroglobulin domain-containing protein n=1 Tax=Elysia crispata TaxID=231223 RepID=A0AAE0XWK7_9GAST|nr:hypothetical protein RRG08_047512 [Elysia crispata]
MSKETVSNRRENKRNVAPPQTVRKYFPEAWLFEEFKLDSTGFKKLDLTLPDSITTWSFMAVSLSPHRGVCVSKPLRQDVQKLFFAVVRLPYKVTRLEEVKVRVAIYNYRLNPKEIKGVVSGVDGICFSANSIRRRTEEDHTFTAIVPSKGIVTEVVKIIPLKNGELTLRVDVQEINGKKERDVVEKKILVVSIAKYYHEGDKQLHVATAGNEGRDVQPKLHRVFCRVHNARLAKGGGTFSCTSCGVAVRTSLALCRSCGVGRFHARARREKQRIFMEEFRRLATIEITN